MRVVFDITDKFAKVLNQIFNPLAIRQDLKEIKQKLGAIMANQEEFDAQIARANTALEDIATSITDEAQQIRDFIAANPAVDTSALEGIVTRLEGVNESVSGVFEPTPAPETPE